MASYISHFRSVQLKTLLKVADVTKERLPTLPKYIRHEKNGLCYTYILGKCQGKRCGKSPEGHTPVGDIIDTFALELCTVLTPGVEKRLVMEPPTTQYQFAGGYSSKREKRTT